MRVATWAYLYRAWLPRLAIVCVPAAVPAQVVDLTIHDVGVAIGDKPRLTGLRLNVMDRRLEIINGINITAWSPGVVPRLLGRPAEAPRGVVTGVALGLPVTDGHSIRGLAVAMLGNAAAIGLLGTDSEAGAVGTGGEITGIAAAPIGFVSSGTMSGIMIGGLAVGARDDMTGLMLGGLGVGSGESLQGVALSGGVVFASRIAGANVAGVAVVSDRATTGINVAGIALWSRGDITGLSAALLIGANRIRGVTVGSTVVAGSVEGLTINAGVLEARHVSGVALGVEARVHDTNALLMTAVTLIEKDGVLRGASLAAWNRVSGQQRGLTIGLFNFARELHGVQVGLLNVSDNGGQRRAWPVFSKR